MIFFSYKFQFDSYLEWFFFSLAKKLYQFPGLQAKILLLGRVFFPKNSRFQALDDYILRLNGGSLHMSPAPRDYASSWHQESAYDFLDLYDIEYVEKALPISLNHSFPNQCVYTFEKSGFFSTIFTAINILFFCDQHGIDLTFDWKNWPYDFDPDIFFNVSNSKVGPEFRDQDILFFSSRNYLDSLDIDSQEFHKLQLFRKQILGKIFNWCEANFHTQSIAPFAGKTACFIRRGDKLIRESYPISSHAYLYNLKKYPNIIVLGDDFYFNERLSKEGNFQHFFVEGHKISGGNMSHVDRSAVNSILMNYYLLCNSENIIGDPCCNLVAAAMMYKGVTYSYDRNLFPWRLRKYA